MESGEYPRAVLFDLRSNFGSMSSLGQYQPQENADTIALTTWSENVDVIERDRVPTSKFQTYLDLRPDNFYYDGNEDDISGNGSKREHADEEQTELKQSEKELVLFDKDKHVDFWSDYLEAHFHSQTLSEVSVEKDMFGTYFAGSIADTSLKELYYERFRYFAEGNE